MKYCGDYHTHSLISGDCRSTLEDNVLWAQKAGLSEIGITDHGMGNWFSYNPKKARWARDEVDRLKEIYPLKILLGVENDIISRGGEIDYIPEVGGLFDINLLGFHFPVWMKSFKDYWTLKTPIRLSKVFPVSKEHVARNTKTVIKALERYPIHVFAHINYNILVNPKEVAKCCADNGIYLELNCKHVNTLYPIMDDLLSTDVKFLAGTDSHKAFKIGNFSALDGLIRDFALDEKRIANLGETVVFERKI